MSASRSPPPPSISVGSDEEVLALQVLYVEDDLDIQAALRDVLEHAGYEVTLACTAEQGLAALRQRRFHLVIADYNLPDKTGAKMLSEAAADGLLNCESLILTGASRLDDVTAYRIIRKPVDVDSFLNRLASILEPVRNEQLTRAKRSLEAKTPSSGPSAKRIELNLYITEASSASLRALRNLRTLLEGYEPSQYELRVVDLMKEQPASFDDDRIIFTPTLVRRFPGPRVYLLGTLENIQGVTDLLADAKVEKKR